MQNMYNSKKLELRSKLCVFHFSLAIALIKKAISVWIGPLVALYNSKKLELRLKLCVFLGYSSYHKGCKCLDRPLVAFLFLIM